MFNIIAGVNSKADKSQVATQLTTVLRNFKKRNKDSFKIGVITVNSKVPIAIYWAEIGDKFPGIDGKYPTVENKRLEQGAKFLVAIPTSSDLTKKNAMFIYDEISNSWGRIPGAYYKKLVEASDLRQSVLESVLDKKELDKKQAILDEEVKLAELIKEYTAVAEKFANELKPASRFGADFRSKDGQIPDIYFQEWRDWDLGTPSVSVYYRTNESFSKGTSDHSLEFSFSSGRISNDEDQKELMKILEEIDKMRSILAKHKTALDNAYEKFSDKQRQIWDMERAS